MFVTVLGDRTVEANETFRVVLSKPVGAALAGSSATATIVNDDAAAISVADASAGEGTASPEAVRFAVVLSTRSASPITVHYATAGGSATAGADFAASTGTVTFPAGVTSEPIAISTIADSVVEGNESFTVTLTNASGASIRRGTAAGTIDDDDTTGISIASASIDEGTGAPNTLAFLVSLSNPSSGSVTVDFVTSDGSATAASDYTALSGTVVIAPGATSAVIAVSTVPDNTVELDETTIVTLSNPVGAPLANASATGNIVNDDATAFSVADASADEGNGSGGTVAFAVTLSNPSSAPATIDYTTEDADAIAGSDYESVSGTLSFTPGVTTATVEVTIDADLVIEPLETFQLMLFNPTGASLARSLGEGTITNDDFGPLPSAPQDSHAMSIWGGNAGFELGDQSIPASFEPVPTQVGSATTWRTAAVGLDHTLAIRTDGTLWAWGSNGTAGALGDGNAEFGVDTPKQIGTDANWQTVATSLYSSYGIRTDGTLWAWGSNANGQLGDGTTISRSAPAQIGTATNWASVSDGGNHVLAIQSDGTLWGWGYNGAHGVLGDGTTTTRLQPEQISNATTWATVSTDDHTVATRTDGTLWAWGDNSFGQLGDGTTASRSTPQQVGTDPTWTKALASSNETVAIKSDGTLWSWGWNVYAGLGDGTRIDHYLPAQVGTATEWTDISARGAVLALQSDGTLWGWGWNRYGVLGDGTITDQLAPVQIGTATNWATVRIGSLGIRTDGTLWTWGSNIASQLGRGVAYTTAPKSVTGPQTWAAVSAGMRFTAGIRSDGTLWTWGNHDPQISGLSLGSQMPTQVGTDTTWAQASVGTSHTLAVRTDGTLWAWGDNLIGELGDGTLESKPDPEQIGTGTHWSSVAAGEGTSLAIRGDGTLWAWGDNEHGQLGDGTTTNRATPVQVGTAIDWARVVASYKGAVAIRTDGTLWAWGDNSFGELGDGTTIERHEPTRIGTATDWSTLTSRSGATLAIKNNGTLWAWGNNAQGQLGDSTTTTRDTPEQIGSRTEWSSVSTDGAHTMALHTDGTLWAWGENGAGQLGDGTTTRRLTPTQIGAATTWTSVSAGAEHSVALHS